MIFTPADKMYITGLYVVLQWLDVATTAVGLRLPGIHEANPVARWMMEDWGELTAYSVKMLIVLAVLVVVLCLQDRFRRLWLSLRTINVLMTLAVTLNLVSIHLAIAGG